MAHDTGTRSTTPTTTGRRWTPLALATLSLLAVPVLGRVFRMIAAIGSDGEPGFPSPAMLSVLAAVVIGGVGLTVGIRSLQHGERSLPVWAGTVLSGLVLAFWVVFAVAEVVAPH